MVPRRRTLPVRRSHVPLIRRPVREVITAIRPAGPEKGRSVKSRIEWQCKHYKVMVSSGSAWSPHEIFPSCHSGRGSCSGLHWFVFVSTVVVVLWYVKPEVTLWSSSERFSVDNSFIPSVFLWFAHNPFATATMVYAASIFGVLLYAYFESRYRV